MELVRRTDIYRVPFANLQLVNDFNIRTDMGDIKELAENIKENGVKVPLMGYHKAGVYYITAGHRRYAACKLLVEQGLTNISVPFMTEPKGTNEEQRIVDTFLTNDGKPLEPLEQAEGVLRLVKGGLSIKQIAKRLGKSDSYVNRLYKLSQSPVELQQAVADHKVSGSLAIETLGKGKEAVDDLILKTTVVTQVTTETKEEVVKHDEGTDELDEDKSGTPSNTKTTGRVTKKDIEPVLNSIKEFKKFAKRDDVIMDEMAADKREVFNFIQKILNSELSATEIFFYFMGEEVKVETPETSDSPI